MNINIQNQKKTNDKHFKKNKAGRAHSDGHKGESGSSKRRTKCNCEARQHQLINNCLGCGRIVCSQEGAGPCCVCGLNVSNQHNNRNKQSKQSENSHPVFKKQNTISIKESLEQRDKLLEYDRDYMRRTQIIDDECDYYKARNIKSKNLITAKDELEQYDMDGNCTVDSERNGPSWHYYSKMKAEPMIEFNQPKCAVTNAESQSIQSIKSKFENSLKCRLQDNEYI